MSDISDIRDRMKLFNKDNFKEEFYSLRGIVKDVNLDDMTIDCVPVGDGPHLLDIQLIPMDADGNLQEGVVFVPELESIVYITMLSKTDGYVTACCKPSHIKLMGDKFGGLIKIEDLVTKINNIENLLNDLISKYNLHTHPYTNVTSPAVTSVTASTEPNTLTPTQKEDIENPLIKHGDSEA